MNVGIFSLGTGYKDASGTGTFLLQMMRRLSSEHEIHFLTSGSGPLRPEIEELDVHVKTFNSLRKTTRLSSLASTAKIKPAEVEMLSILPQLYPLKRYIERELDVLSTHYYLDNLILSNLVDIPTVFRFPGIRQPSVRWRAMTKLAQPTVYLANSESTAARVRQWLDIDPDGVVYAGVDTDRFSPDTEPAFECDCPAVLFVGRLDEGKGLRDLLHAISRLDTPVRLYLVGSGTLEQDLHELTHELGLDETVEFVGAVPHDDVPHYYAAADVFCLPSYHESFGMVNIEAMACGCPVISTRIDAIEEYLVDGETGLLIDPGDIEALCKGISRLIEDAPLRDRLATNGLDCADAFSWDSQAKKMSKFYERSC